MQRRTVLLAGTIFLVVTALIAYRSVRATTSFAEIHMLDVGQGDAVLIELPDTTQILIDGGPDASVLLELAEVLGPFDRSIDVVIATHPDADHIGGLLDVLAHYHVEHIVDSGIVKDTALYRAWVAAASDEGARVTFADGAKRFRFGNVAALDLLWPHESLVDSEEEHVNEYSVVARFTYGNVSTLLTGDIERWAEYQLVRGGALSDVDILKVPHHGSKTSTTALLLDAVKPELALLSVGAENRYGHPDDGVLARLSERGIPILRTDHRGRITIQTDGVTYWRY